MADISQLVQNALNGDRASFDALYTETNRAVYFTCLGFLKNEEDALDVMQDVYIAAFDKLGTLKDPQTFPAWVKRIAVNRCKNFLVKKNAHYEQSIDSEENITELVDENFLPDEYAESEEKRRIVMKIVRDVLSDTLYQTVMMFYFDELTIAEIAEIMDCPEGTVKYRLNAARVKIKKGVLDYENKNDERLHAVVMIPFLTRLFAEISKNTDVPQIPIENVLPKANSAPDASQTVTNGGKKMLNSLKSKVIAGVCAAVVVGGGITAAVLVSKNAAKPTGTVTSRPTVTYSARPNSVFTGNTSKPSVSTPTTESTPEEVKFAMTDEIKNAALGSGLVQINNDTFQRGGYITVADFVEKYKDSYDITYYCPGHYNEYDNGPVAYDVGKDYLVEYNDEFINDHGRNEVRWQRRRGSAGGDGIYEGCRYYLTLTPKSTNTANKINAYVVNASSPNEKITLDKAVVVQTEPWEDKHYNAPEWYPMGFNCFDFKDKYESENKNYTVNNLGEALEAKGMKKCSEEMTGMTRDVLQEEDYNTYWVTKSSARCFVVGEENLFGAKPVYYYIFHIDGNTDKIDYVECYLAYFVKE